MHFGRNSLKKPPQKLLASLHFWTSLLLPLLKRIILSSISSFQILNQILEIRKNLSLKKPLRENPWNQSVIEINTKHLIGISRVIFEQKTCEIERFQMRKNMRNLWNIKSQFWFTIYFEMMWSLNEADVLKSPPQFSKVESFMTFFHTWASSPKVIHTLICIWTRFAGPHSPLWSGAL